MAIAPPYPADLSALLAPGLSHTLDTPVLLGAAQRLLGAAWQSKTPCRLPDDVSSLAAVAGVTPEEWAGLQPALFLALGVAKPPEDASSGLLVLRHAHEVYQSLLEKAERTARQRSIAGRGNRKRQEEPERPVNGPSTARQRPVPSGVPDPGTLVSGGVARARGALERSDSMRRSERSSAEATVREKLDAGAIAGSIHAGLEANAEAALNLWRKQQATVILTAAFARWQDRIVNRKMGADGRSGAWHGRERTDWAKDICAIVACPHVTPAAAEIAVLRCDQAHASPDRGPVPNPVGYVINALGARRGGRPLEPMLSDQPIVARWDEKGRQVFDSAKVRAAAENAALRFVAQADRTIGQKGKRTGEGA